MALYRSTILATVLPLIAALLLRGSRALHLSHKIVSGAWFAWFALLFLLMGGVFKDDTTGLLVTFVLILGLVGLGMVTLLVALWEAWRAWPRLRDTLYAAWLAWPWWRRAE